MNAPNAHQDTLLLIRNRLNWTAEYSDILQGLDRDLSEKITSFADDFHKSREVVQDSQRKLKLGIIGQVKAGKSTLLNELLFGGKSVLPEAATPMTAALTELVHGPAFEVELCFYETADWEKIQASHDYVVNALEFKRQSNAKELQEFRSKSRPSAIAPLDMSRFSEEEMLLQCEDEIGLEEKAAYEVVKSARKIKNLTSLLGSNKVHQYDTLDSLKEAMGDFVGADGKWTPIVKSCILRLNLPELEAIDLVDTPGMNDPVTSRGLKTQRYLRECDAVFVLSTSGQFLDQKDLDLLRTYLPAEGIASICLLASKYDSGLVQESRRFKGDLGETNRYIRDTFQRETQRKLAEIGKTVGKDSIIQRLQGIEPMLVSSYFAQYARKMRAGAYSDVQKDFGFNRIQKAFPQTPFQADLLEAYAGFTEIRAKLEGVKNQKDQIRQQRLEDLDREKIAALEALLSELKKQVETRLQLLETGDLSRMQADIKKMTSQLRSCSSQLETIFSDRIIEVIHKLKELRRDIDRGSASVEDVNVNTREETYSYQVEKDGWVSKAARALGLGGYETRTGSRTIRSVDSYEAIAKLESYAREARIKVEEEIGGLLAGHFKDSLRNDLKKVIVSKVQMDSVDFDPDTILDALQRSINHLSVKSFSFDERSFVETVANKFSGTIGESEISKLRDTLRKAVSSLLKEISKVMDDYTEEIRKGLDESGKMLTQSIIANLEHEMADIKSQMTEKKQSIASYKKLMAAIGR